jgi:hypothetical protein
LEAAYLTTCRHQDIQGISQEDIPEWVSGESGKKYSYALPGVKKEAGHLFKIIVE